MMDGMNEQTQYTITYRQKDKGWQYIISKKENGKWGYGSSKQGFRTKALAKLAAEKKVDEFKKEDEKKGKANLIEEHDKITLRQFKKMFLSSIELHKAVNTLLSYEAAFDKLILDDMLIDNIEFAHIQDCVNKMIKAELAPSSIRLHVSKWNVLFKAAVKPYKIIAESPITGDLMLPKVKKDTKVKALTKTELDDLLNKMYPEKDFMICLLASHCGPRIGEILGLCRNDIDLKKRRLDINKQWKEKKDGTYDFGSVKSQARVVPIPKSIIPLLEEYLSSNVRNFDGRIFRDKKTKNTGSRINQKIKQMGFDNSLHDLRHTYATRLVLQGLNFQTIAEYLGDDVKTVIDTYSHFTKDMEEIGDQKVNEAF